jgi:molybdopterin synthase catalytic subunit
MTIQKRDFSIGRVLEDVMDSKAGAVVSFIGSVRRERGLKAIDYEAYDEMARIKLEELRAQAIKKFKLTDAVVVHRKGRLKVGEKVVIVACSAPHRKEAFKACEWLISEVKKVVPIWKREV